MAMALKACIEYNQVLWFRQRAHPCERCSSWREQCRRGWSGQMFELPESLKEIIEDVPVHHEVVVLVSWILSLLGSVQAWATMTHQQPVAVLHQM